MKVVAQVVVEVVTIIEQICWTPRFPDPKTVAVVLMSFGAATLIPPEVVQFWKVEPAGGW